MGRRVKAYNPSDRISLCALMKFEKCTSYKVLTELEKSQRKRETVMEKASFTQADWFTQMELYPDVKSTAMCMESWLKSPSEATLPPIWDNFLHVILKEVKLDHVAKGIEEYLTSTIVNTPEETISDMENQRKGFEVVAQIRSELDSLCSYLTDVDLSPDDVMIYLKEKIKTCHDKCQVVFQKLGKEKQEHAQQINQLEQQIQELKQRGSEVMPNSSQDAKLKPTIQLLQRELHTKCADMWEDIGIQLGIDDGELQQLKSDNQGNCKACLREMLRKWLKRVDPAPTWAAIAEAIEILGEEALAHSLRSKYCGENNSET